MAHLGCYASLKARNLREVRKFYDDVSKHTPKTLPETSKPSKPELPSKKPDLKHEKEPKKCGADKRALIDYTERKV